MNRSVKGVVWVTGVYFYFLIFAQFAFLELLAAQSFDENALKQVMGPMALGGILGSFAVLFLQKRFPWTRVMQVAAALCAVLAWLAGSGWAMGLGGYAAIALGIGVGLGLLTVLLASHLAEIFSHSKSVKSVYWGAGLGTGLAYMLSNLPWVFQASPADQAMVSSVMMLGLSLLPIRPRSRDLEVEQAQQMSGDSLSLFPVGVLCFTMLVWLDSAAFYIIQHTREIKLATWGESFLWRNAAVHLIVAVFSAYLLMQGKMKWVIGMAFGLLGVAGLMASVPDLSAVAGYLYPAGVSLYSVALILYPAVWLCQNPGSLRAAVLFAVAGWVGSALGIGMAQDLNQVPAGFVLLAGGVIFIALSWRVLKQRKAEVLVCLSVLLVCFGLSQIKNQEFSDVPVSQIDLGREVYISEGCIHCHSQYVRPGSRDELLWGPVRPLDEVLSQVPVLIGNRRQGPDLMQVGLRRSRGWMKQHFLNPQSLAPQTSMPNYAHLFEDGRGEALMAYLSAYDSDELSERASTVQEWTLAESVQSSGDGAALFAEHCATCHGADGQGAGPLASLWVRPPANLVAGPFPFTPVADANGGLARVIKFGILGMDMPGHETLSDPDLKSLVEFVTALRTSNP